MSKPKTPEEPPAAPAPLPPPTDPFEWSFYYSGPREPVSDFARCTHCLARAQKRCPTHGDECLPSCPHCQTVRDGCRSHWGLVAALDDREKHLEGAVARSDFALARALVLAELPHPTRSHVQVSLRGSGSLASRGERALVVEVKII